MGTPFFLGRDPAHNFRRRLWRSGKCFDRSRSPSTARKPSRGFREYTVWRRFAGSGRGGLTYGNCRKRHEHECDLERGQRPGWQRRRGDNF
jgi:hypothetical protein